VWIRIEKTDQKLRIISTSHVLEEQWKDHPVIHVRVQFPDCPASSMALIANLKLKKNTTPEQYALAKSEFLQRLTSNTLAEQTCSVTGINSVILPEGVDFYKGAILTVDFVQADKLWNLTFELTPSKTNKLSVRLLSSSP